MRPQFNRVMKVKVPPSLQSAVENAAHREHSTISDFIRRIMIDRLRADGVLLNPPPKNHDPIALGEVEQHGATGRPSFRPVAPQGIAATSPMRKNRRRVA
jgi:hypothetical protein